ncbi:hypothetical protein HYT33_04495 [Candidatus Roizmanbacteria bacterium]|nr:hypothetical protein [Candidatus Roizmanbacteria bacterium]
MGRSQNVLSDPSLLILITYAPAGLGHLRVADALRHGLPKDANVMVLGAEETSLTYLHRFISIHPVARELFEWGQKGAQEEIFTRLYRGFLRKRAETVYEEMMKLISHAKNTIKTMLVVATHMGLAHQLAKVKKRIERETGVSIILVVQVTDDSPMKAWYVEEADLILAPSEYTRKALYAYAQRAGLDAVPTEFSPYPVSPFLSDSLDAGRYESRYMQVDPHDKSNVDILIPISGAAVGTKFFQRLIEILHERSPRFVFHVVSKEAPFTQTFLKKVTKYPFVDLHASDKDRALVDMYEEVYRREVVSLEITKPSEQSFKALVNPTQIGGSILLLTSPVGRQEQDNLVFLRRHNLIPKTDEQRLLWEQATKGTGLSNSDGRKFLEQAVGWRGVELPRKPEAASDFIMFCLNEGIFKAMMTCCVIPNPNDQYADEIKPNGVEEFWKKAAALLQRKK